MDERERRQLGQTAEGKKDVAARTSVRSDVSQKSLAELFSERDQWADRFLIERQRFEEERQNFVEELERREKEFVSRQKAQADAFSKRERFFEEQLKEVSDRAERQEMEYRNRRRILEDKFEKINRELEERQKQIDLFQADLENEKDRLKKETQEKLQHNSSDFVSGMVGDLKLREADLFKVSHRWSIFGGVSLVAAIMVFVYLSVLSSGQVKSDMSWAYLTFYAFKGVFLAGISGIISRYAFVLSLNHMSEALRTTDRIHAIKFGQLYVESYGASANWDQVKEAFSNWNGAEKPRVDSGFESGSEMIKLSDIVTSVKELAKGKE